MTTSKLIENHLEHVTKISRDPAPSLLEEAVAVKSPIRPINLRNPKKWLITRVRAWIGGASNPNASLEASTKTTLRCS
jgi:hypothetical protein